MRVRTAYQPYLDRVKVYLDNLLPLVADLQFTRGGPIIGLQVEMIFACTFIFVSTYIHMMGVGQSVCMIILTLILIRPVGERICLIRSNRARIFGISSANILGQWN